MSRQRNSNQAMTNIVILESLNLFVLKQYYF